ncbi:MAG TPA: hypothetical protein PKD78_01060 [Saprospiraceae bacterium]|nr:hypothetical protein [Saprospiraceae bacterium]
MLKALKFSLLPFAAFLMLLVACNKSNETTTDQVVDEVLYSVQERGGLGKYGCFELVFPVTIVLPDSTTATVNSYDEMKQTLRAYFDANGGGNNGGGHHNHGAGERPRISFVFPISVVSQDGEVITVETQEELRELRAACGGASFGNHGPNGHGQHGLSCFEIVFPITIQFPDSSTVAVNSRQELHQTLRDWRKNNPGATARPQIVFPITVKMTDDGTLVTVNSRDELRQLKEDCE